MWTPQSYNALFDYANPAKKDHARQTMLADGLIEEVATLDKSKSLGDWYRMTTVAAEAVGPKVVEESANQAEHELNKEALKRFKPVARSRYSYRKGAKRIDKALVNEDILYDDLDLNETIDKALVEDILNETIDKALVEDILYDDLDLNETMAIMDGFRAWLKAARPESR